VADRTGDAVYALVLNAGEFATDKRLQEAFFRSPLVAARSAQEIYGCLCYLRLCDHSCRDGFGSMLQQVDVSCADPNDTV